MINSMTGYGAAQGQYDGVAYTIEVKTVNNRYFKARLKLPESLSFLEKDIEKVLRENLSRGMVNFSLELKNVSENIPFDIDEAALGSLMERLSKIASSSESECTIDMSGLLTIPGILSPVQPDKSKVEEIKDNILSISQQAIDDLIQMRAAEGAALASDMIEHCKTIENNLKKICAQSGSVPEEQARKLTKRVNSLLAEAKLQLNEEMLAREVAIFADRSDVSEEIARLESHLQQFTESCQQSCEAEGQIGRRMDFICQEMLREANTIASKSSDIEITRCVVEMKSLIDRLKEQVQNIE